MTIDRKKNSNRRRLQPCVGHLTEPYGFALSPQYVGPPMLLAYCPSMLTAATAQSEDR